MGLSERDSNIMRDNVRAELAENNSKTKKELPNNYVILPILRMHKITSPLRHAHVSNY